MSTPFSRTLRSLASDRGRLAATAMISAMTLGLLWGLWLTLAEVPLYLVSAQARLEAADGGHPLMAQVDGQVIALNARIGDTMETGEIVIGLAAAVESSQLQGVESTIAGLLDRRELVIEERETIRRALATEAVAAERGLERARARTAAAEADESIAQVEASRQRQLASDGVVSELDRLRFESNARKAVSEADQARAEFERLAATESADRERRRSEIKRLNRQIATIEVEAQEAEALAKQLAAEADRRAIRSPIDGILAELADLRLGQFVAQGDRLGVVLPDSDIEVVANFPVSALGRLRAGQRAEMRLDAYPWANFGRLQARVLEVADESRNGRVRVHLVVDRIPPAIAVAHGLTGQVHVEIERTRPLDLLLQAIGRSEPVPRQVRDLNPGKP